MTVQGTGAGGVGALTGTGAGARYDGAVTLAAAATVGGGGTLTLNGIIGDGGSAYKLSKEGAGTLVLGGANSYTGGTDINAGTVRLGASGVLADAGAVTLANAVGVTLDVNGKTETIGTLSGGGATGGTVNVNAGTLTVTQGANQTFAGVVSGSGTFNKAGASTLTLSNSGNSFSGTTNITAGTLSVSDAAALNTASSVVVNGGTLDINNVTLNTLAGMTVQGTGAGGVGALTGTGAGARYDGAVTLAAATTVGGGGTLTLNGIIGDGGSAYKLSKEGAGTLVLGGANSYTGLLSSRQYRRQKEL
jgi:autotransporter-associated beta strand protein